MKALAALLMTGALSLFSQGAFAKGIVIPMDATQSSIDFGQVAIGSYNYEVIDVIAGTDTLTIDVGLTGDMFSVAHNCPATLDPGKTCHIFVIFEPTSDGDFTGQLTVNTSGGDYLFDLTGTGFTDSGN